MSNNFKTKIRLSDNKVYQDNNDNLTLSGDTTIAPLGGLYIDEQNPQDLVMGSYLRRDNNGKVVISNNKPGYFVGLNQDNLPEYNFDGIRDLFIHESNYILHDNANNLGEAENYIISEKTLNVSFDNVLYYVVVEYNSGEPQYNIITDKTTINYSSVIPVFSVFTVDSVLHITPWLTGRGLANNIENSLIQGFKFIRVNGLEFDVIPDRKPKINQGFVVYGVNQLTLGEALAGESNVNLYECVYDGSDWNLTLVNQLQNTHYQGSTGKLELTEGNYSLAWVFRGVSDTTIKNIYYFLGSGDNDIVYANDEQPPNIPDFISENAIPISKVFIKKGENIPEKISWFYDKFFGVVAHGSLIGLGDSDAHPATSISVVDKEFVDDGEKTNVLNVLKQTRQNVTRHVIQSSHGFVVGDVVGLHNDNGGTKYHKVLASNIKQVKPVGIVSRVSTDGNSFVVTQSGYITGLPSGLNLTQDETYYISTETAGKLRVIDNNKTDNYPILITKSATSGWVLPSLGITETPFNDQENIIYFSKTGSDSNNGLTINKPVNTITKALEISNTLPFLATDNISISCLDSGEYEENFTVNENRHLYAPNATIKGTITLKKNASVIIDTHLSSADNTRLLNKQGDGVSSYRCRLSDGRGHNTVTNIRNITNSSILFAHVDIMYIGQFGRGIQDASGGSNGHVHFNIMDMYLQGNTSRGIDLSNNSDLIGYIDHILKIDTASNTIGINIGGTGNVNLRLTVGEIKTDSAWDINNSNAKVWLNCLNIEGDKTLTAGETLLNTVKAVRVIEGDGTNNEYVIGNPFQGIETLNVNMFLVETNNLIPVEVAWQHDTLNDNIVIEFDYVVPTTETYNIIITR